MNKNSVRHYVNVALRYNENLTDEDRVRLELTVPDTKLFDTKIPEQK
ncbi:MAG: hypothetical protein LBR86_00940 [Tannerella sp.]|jgi:hypothetical protein|nr:hypothetical protein [Tannerella sp.]